MKKLLVLFCLGFSSLCFAKNPQSLHAFAGVGNNYHVPGTIRVGYGPWEAGLVTMNTYGGGRRFFFNGTFYCELGVLVTGGMGLYSGMGFDWTLIAGFALRGELMGRVKYTGHMDSRGAVGAAYAF